MSSHQNSAYNNESYFQLPGRVVGPARPKDPRALRPAANRAPRIGRPPVAAEDRRATLVRVLTTEAEHAELRRAAEAASMSVSTWVRAAALEKARR